MTDPAARPSVYEFVGGADALRALIDAFYAKVRVDPLLTDLFAHFTDEHVDHVVLWLGEVFGGPPAFTERLGGHHGLLRRHLGLAITEAQRARFAGLLVETAGELLPAVDLLQRQFAAYVDWGTRIAMEVSAPGVTVDGDPGPVPRWGWDGLVG